MSGFKQVVSDVTTNLNSDLSSEGKEKTFQSSKKHIILRKVIEGIEASLDEDEFICDYLPFSNGENTGVFTTGWAGMEAATKSLSKEYVKEFNDNRGNRMFLFTNKRIIFVFPLHYLETSEFISYPYDKIKAITLKKNKKGKIRKDVEWYYLDFQVNQHIFTETLTVRDKDKLLQIVNKVPRLKEIPIVKHVVRTNKFDQFFSNINFSVKIVYILNFICYGTLIIILLGTFFGFGPFGFIKELWMEMRNQ
ncbi:PH domain-containing protein [Enterococcus rivorum]|uniref:PH domain-containing protein n=1 Tax=Enterococcus rivorum TaxID=762845 RepID=UPI000A04BC87|nr:PH domain-containing protein [Enterococcus rivorum]MBP2098085.1 hypothetical protein [Enterococcus rivorum]